MEMGLNKKIYLWSGIALLVVALLVGAGYYGFTQQSVYGTTLNLAKETVYIPEFSRTECAVIKDDYILEYDYARGQDSNGWRVEYCSGNNHDPNGDGDAYTFDCRLEWETNEAQGFNGIVEKVFVCPKGSTFADTQTVKCQPKVVSSTQQYAQFSSNQVVFMRASESAGFGIGRVEQGDITLRKIADWYGLENIDSSNYLTREVTCDVSRIAEKYPYLKQESVKAPSGILPPKQVFQYITESKPAISKSVIDYQGKKVWTRGNQEYCEIKEDVNGVRFVDVQDCKQAPEIICNPTLPYCSDDGTEIINIDTTGGTAGGKTCNQLFGVLKGDRSVNPENPRQSCQVSCENNAPVRTDCQTIPSCEGKGILNQNFECVSATVADQYGEKTDQTLIYVILALIFVLAVALLYQGGKKK